MLQFQRQSQHVCALYQPCLIFSKRILEKFCSFLVLGRMSKALSYSALPLGGFIYNFYLNLLFPGSIFSCLPGQLSIVSALNDSIFLGINHPFVAVLPARLMPGAHHQCLNMCSRSKFVFSCWCAAFLFYHSHMSISTLKFCRILPPGGDCNPCSVISFKVKFFILLISISFRHIRFEFFSVHSSNFLGIGFNVIWNLIVPT